MSRSSSVFALCMVLSSATPASAQLDAPDDSSFAQTIESLRWAYSSLGAHRIHATADSLVRALEGRGMGESPRAYLARELLVEATQSLRHRPAPETCNLAERILRYRVHTAAADSVSVVRSLQLAARCAHRSGDLDHALGYHRRAAAILTRVRGPESYELSVQLNNFASVLSDAGLYRNMRDTLERALAVRLRHRPSGDPTVLLIKNNLAVALEAEGDVIAARPLYEEVLAGYEKAFGPIHAKTGYALHNLARTMAGTGEPRRALALFERSLAVRESTTTTAQFEVGETLTSMSELLVELGEFSRARPLLERALEIQTRELRADHPYRVRALLGLATVDRAAGDHDAARRRSHDALATLDSAGASAHPDRAKALVSLGESELAAGRPGAAIPYFERAVAIDQDVLGDDHPRTATVMRLLAEAMAQMGDPGALAMALDAEQRQRAHLRRSFRALSERQAFAVRGALASGLDVALSCLPSVHPDSARAATWDALIRARGMLLDEIASRIQFEPAGDSVLARLARSFSAHRQREVNLAVRGPGAEALDYRRRLLHARQERDSAEAALARASAAFRAERARQRLGWRDVISSLPPGAALVGYVRHERVALVTAPATDTRSSYGAFVVRHGERWPSFTPLGDAALVDSLVVAWRAAASARDVGEAGYRRAGDALREQIWDPITARLEGTRLRFIVPDGMLGLVNHATLPVGATGYLLEHDAAFHYLSGERELIDDRPARDAPGELLAVGGVDYETVLGPPRPPPRAPGPRRSRSGPATRRGATVGTAPSDCFDLATLEFIPLPETRREVDDVCAIWGARQRGAARTLVGSNATERALRALAPRARALHLATHGFFVDPACSQRLGAVGPARLSNAYENAMVRTGLALAGANRKRLASPLGDDGILTAAEFAAMDLRGLDWVVLSGCDTGAGTPASLEGLLGLRRAFELSGAGTVIMSLWGIEDAPARRWTRTLYAARFGQQRSAADAVREASVALLRVQRAAGMGGHPGAWGSFVASGSWR